MPSSQQELSKIYHRRFARTAAYRNKVWEVISREFIQKWVAPGGTVMDLGCGYGEFINNIAAAKKYAMDLNPDAPSHLAKNVAFLHQDCSSPWPVPENSLDVIFTSNFFEHLPDKESLSRTLRQALRSLKPGGRLIAIGPNIAPAVQYSSKAAGVMAEGSVYFGGITVVAGLFSTLAGGWLGDLLTHWTVVPTDPAGWVKPVSYVGLVASILVLTLVRDPIRTVLLVPVLVLASFVWENVMLADPSSTRYVVLGAILVAVMIARPAGLLGERRVEIV